MTAFRALASAAVLALASACTNFYEVPVETPLQPKMDVSKFQRILVAGFVAGGTDEIDTNLETARLLRSQLRTNSSLEVIDAEVIELLDVAEQQAGFVTPQGGAPAEGAAGTPAEADAEGGEDDDTLSEEDLEAYEHIFADASYWRQLGEEYQGPLIVTGTVHFAPHQHFLDKGKLLAGLQGTQAIAAVFFLHQRLVIHGIVRGTLVAHIPDYRWLIVKQKEIEAKI